MRRLGVRGDDHTFMRRRALTRNMDTITSDEDEETAARLRERWRFDHDDEPTIGPEGADE
jgi:enhancer of polycomb-like protein